MRLTRCLAAGLAVVCLALPSRADSPRPPLHLVHESADLLFEVPDPRLLVESFFRLDLLKQLEVFPSYREALQSTPLRRGKQLVAYLEKQLGAPWPELLDRLAGGGAVVAVKFAPDPAPALLVIGARDEKLLARFYQVALDVVDQEIARQEGKERLTRSVYQGLPTAHAGPNFWVGLAGPSLVVSNNEKALQSALDRHLGREKKSLADSKTLEDSRRLLPTGPLARLWVSLDAAHNSPQGKALYKMPRDDFNLTVAFGGYIDLVGRSPYVCAGLYRQDDGLLLSIRMPRGRDGMGSDQILHLPPAGQPGSRPLLEPKGVLYSDSNYFNFPAIWQERTKLFPAKQVEALEKFDKTSAPFLLGKRMSELLTQVGPYYRFIAATQPKAGYQTTSDVIIPAFALVSELREPEAFGKSMEAILRSAALLASGQVKLKLVEDQCNGCKLIGWRFAEGAPFPNDTTNFRFNFSPCFARVGNQFLYCSTLELGREMIGLLQKEQKDKPPSADVLGRGRLYAAGLADVFEVTRDALVAQAILDQAVKPDEAREQIKSFLDLLRRMGHLDIGAHYAPSDFHYDVRLTVGK
jgi:hypothetical protein